MSVAYLQMLGYEAAKVRASRLDAPRLIELCDGFGREPDSDSDRLPGREGSRYVPSEVRSAGDASAVLHLERGEGGGGFVGGVEEAAVELLDALNGRGPLASVASMRHLVDVADVRAVADDEELFGVGCALQLVIAHADKIARKRPIVKRACA